MTKQTHPQNCDHISKSLPGVKLLLSKLATRCTEHTVNLLSAQLVNGRLMSLFTPSSVLPSLEISITIPVCASTKPSWPNIPMAWDTWLSYPLLCAWLAPGKPYGMLLSGRTLALHTLLWEGIMQVLVRTRMERTFTVH